MHFPQSGNHWNTLSRIFDKTFVKAMFLRKNWFHRKKISAFFHTDFHKAVYCLKIPVKSHISFLTSISRKKIIGILNFLNSFWKQRIISLIYKLHTFYCSYIWLNWGERYKKGGFMTFDMLFFMILLEGSKRSFQVVKMVLTHHSLRKMMNWQKSVGENKFKHNN